MPPIKKVGQLKVEYRTVASLKPDSKNARKHPPEQITKLARLIKEMGWTNPILVDGKSGIVAGHGRLQAAKQLGMQHVPCIELAGLTEGQKRAYLIADNRAALDAGWDKDLLASEFADLRAMGIDLSLTGFEIPDINLILEPSRGAPTEPETPDPQKRAVSKRGDLWLLGEHRVLCGDATSPKDVQALMEGREAQVVFTDPPYGVSYEGQSGQYEILAGDDKRRGELVKMLTDAFRNAMQATKKDAGWYIWHASRTRDDFAAAMSNVGLVEQSYIIWARNALCLGWNDYQWTHEPCFYASRQGQRPAFHHDHGLTTTVWHIGAVDTKGETSATLGTGIVLVAEDGQEIFIGPTLPKGRKLRQVRVEPGKAVRLSKDSPGTTLWEVGRDTSGKEGPHPTMKPVELGRRALRNSSLEGEIVLDMFAGSGTTLIAAEQTRRLGYVLELEPRYVDVIIRRWQTMTEKAATHGKDGKTFAEHEKARAGKARG